MPRAPEITILDSAFWWEIDPAADCCMSAGDARVLRRLMAVSRGHTWGHTVEMPIRNWRVGFMAAPADLVDRLLDTKLLSKLTTPALLEKALAWCIDQGQLRRHAERIRTRLDLARARSVKLALEAGCRFAAEPAGVFGGVDTGVDTDALSQRMLDLGYLLAPGALFHARREPSTLMRINFATMQQAQFWRDFRYAIT